MICKALQGGKSYQILISHFAASFAQLAFASLRGTP
jgi:hypothetical protein